jgi:hypothetical protein
MTTTMTAQKVAKYGPVMTENSGRGGHNKSYGANHFTWANAAPLQRRKESASNRSASWDDKNCPGADAGLMHLALLNDHSFLSSFSAVQHANVKFSILRTTGRILSDQFTTQLFSTSLVI